MGMMKFAGKNEDGNAQAIALTNEGVQKINRTWKVEQTVLYNKMPDTDGTLMSMDVSNYCLFSLYIENTTDVDIELQFTSPNNQGSFWFLDSMGEYPKITIQAYSSGKGRHFIIPEDMPIMNYIAWLNLRIGFTSAPTTGTLKVTVIGKR